MYGSCMLFMFLSMYYAQFSHSISISGYYNQWFPKCKRSQMYVDKAWKLTSLQLVTFFPFLLSKKYFVLRTALHLYRQVNHGYVSFYWDLCCSGMLRNVDWLLSYQCFRTTCRPHFQRSVYLTLKDGIDMLSWNIGNYCSAL